MSVVEWRKDNGNGTYMKICLWNGDMSGSMYCCSNMVTRDTDFPPNEAASSHLAARNVIPDINDGWYIEPNYSWTGGKWVKSDI
jgi:hypothetical protein